MSPQCVETARRSWRWVLPGACLALAPKCLLCVLAYAGLGAALGLGGPELCGVPTDAPRAWVSGLLLPSAVVVCGGVATWARAFARAGSQRRPRGSKDVAGGISKTSAATGIALAALRRK